jgi:hypothetical protein
MKARRLTARERRAVMMIFDVCALKAMPREVSKRGEQAAHSEFVGYIISELTDHILSFYKRK